MRIMRQRGERKGANGRLFHGFIVFYPVDFHLYREVGGVDLSNPLAAELHVD